MSNKKVYVLIEIFEPYGSHWPSRAILGLYSEEDKAREEYIKRNAECKYLEDISYSIEEYTLIK